VHACSWTGSGIDSILGIVAQYLCYTLLLSTSDGCGVCTSHLIGRASGRFETILANDAVPDSGQLSLATARCVLQRAPTHTALSNCRLRYKLWYRQCCQKMLVHIRCCASAAPDCDSGPLNCTACGSTVPSHQTDHGLFGEQVCQCYWPCLGTCCRISSLIHRARGPLLPGMFHCKHYPPS
jgi:hypothetical protein